jgi:hypothetical protein
MISAINLPSSNTLTTELSETTIATASVTEEMDPPARWWLPSPNGRVTFDAAASR